MIQIPKFIKDVTRYFQYETSPTPTTEDELQAFHKNQNSTLACLVDQLWQPETTYELNHQVFSPNMPKGFKAIVKQAGITGSNEPDWGDGSEEVVDGSVTWKLSKGNITVNGVEPDQNGNITIPTYSPDFASDSEAIQGTSVTKIMTPKANNAVLGNIGYWQPSKSVTLNTVKFLKGEKYVGYYLKCTTGGTTGAVQPTTAPPAINGVTTNISDGTVKWSMYGMLYATKLEGLAVATQSKDGLLSATDKKKIDSMVANVGYLPYATCTNNGTTRVATIVANKPSTFSLTNGIIIAIKFSYALPTTTSGLTLNVNSTGAKAVNFGGGGSPSSGYRAQNIMNVCLMVYNNGSWSYIGNTGRWLQD